MATLLIFLGICGLAAALTGLLWVTTGQYRQYREQKQVDREHAVQQRLRAIKVETDRLERELGIRDEHKNLLHPKPRKRFAYDPNGQLLNADEAATWRRFGHITAGGIYADRIYPPKPEPTGLRRVGYEDAILWLTRYRESGHKLVLLDDCVDIYARDHIAPVRRQVTVQVCERRGDGYVIVDQHVISLTRDEHITLRQMCGQ